MHLLHLSDNSTRAHIVQHALMAALSLFVNGFGIYLTIQVNLGAAPWDVLNLGISHTLNILYGTASIAVSLTILTIDILMKEPVGIAMFVLSSDPNYFDPMLEDSFGKKLLCGAVGLELLAIFTIKKIVDIDM